MLVGFPEHHAAELFEGPQRIVDAVGYPLLVLGGRVVEGGLAVDAATQGVLDVLFHALDEADKGPRRLGHVPDGQAELHHADDCVDAIKSGPDGRQDDLGSSHFVFLFLTSRARKDGRLKTRMNAFELLSRWTGHTEYTG